MRSPKVWLLVALSLALFGIGVNTQSGWAFLLVALAAAALVFSYVWARFSLSGLSVERHVTPEVRQGSLVGVELVVRSAGRRPRLLIVARDELFDRYESPEESAQESGPAAGSEPARLQRRPPWRRPQKGNKVVFVSVSRDRPARLSYQAAASRRGHFDAADVVLSTSAPLGLVEFRRPFRVVSPVTVYPRYAELSSLPVLEATSTPAEQVHERGRKGSGLEYYGSREYASGDSLRFVHWRAVARTSRLMVKEFEREAASTATILLDNSAGHDVGGGVSGDGATAAAESSLDYGAAVAASVCRYILRAGHPVRLVASGPAGPIVLEQPDWWQALSWLARVKADGGLSMEELVRYVAAEVEPRCTMVIIAPTLDMNCSEIFAEAQRHHARAIGILLSAGTFLEVPPEGAMARPAPSAPKVLSADECRELVDSLTEGRAIVYMCRKGDDIAECLRQPYVSTGA